MDLATKAIDVWETDTGTKRASVDELPTALWCMCISHSGKTLAVAGCNLKQDAQFATDYEPGEIALWDLVSGSKLRSFGSWKIKVSGLAFSPDDRTLASCSWDGPVQLWDVATGSVLAALPLSQEERSTSHITYSPDGHYLAAVGHGEIFVWDAKTRERTANLPDEGYSPSTCLSFSPDGRYLAAGGSYMQWYYVFRGCRVVVWNVGTWKMHRQVKGRIDPGADLVWRVAFSLDSSRLALGSARGFVGLVQVEQ
jgi:WD40 repeat protein